MMVLQDVYVSQTQNQLNGQEEKARLKHTKGKLMGNGKAVFLMGSNFHARVVEDTVRRKDAETAAEGKREKQAAHKAALKAWVVKDKEQLE